MAIINTEEKPTMSALEDFKKIQVIAGLKDANVDGLNGPKTEEAIRLLGLKARGEWNSTRGNSALYFNGIIDIYHAEAIDFDKVKAAGIAAIIHKATEGTAFKDNAYHTRKKMAKDRGFLWGGYHFSSGDKGIVQAQHYLQYCNPEKDDLICLDFEPSSHGADMTISEAEAFVSEVQWRTGRWPMIYGGSLLREGLAGKSSSILKNCPLWYARYTKEPIGIPHNTWNNFTLWQFTDGDNGIEPKKTAGVGPCDRNLFRGTEEELKKQWPLS